MPNYSRNNSSRTRNEVQIKDFLGLRSSPGELTPPNALNVAKNFYFSQKGVLDTRQDLTYKVAETEAGYAYNSAEFTTTSGSSYLAYPKLRRLAYFNGTALAYATFNPGSGSTEQFLSNTTTVRDIVSAFNSVYVVDGTQYIYKFNGSTVTRQAIPEYATFGNPVTICYFASRLFVTTDTGYMLYTEPGVDDVWEERVLLPGTVAASGATITGTGTIFQDTQIEKGTRLLIVNGSTKEYALVANTVSNTSITTASNLSNTFAAGSLIYYIGSTYQEKLELTDGLIPRKMVSFGNQIAVTKTSKDPDSPSSKLLVIDFQPIDGSSALLTRVRRISTGYNLHPYSLCEWEDSLLYWTDRGLYVVATPPTDSNVIKPEYISETKLEDYTSDLALQKRSLSRISKVNTTGKNLITIIVAVSDNANYADTLLVGYEVEPFNFEFTSFDFFTEVLNDNNLTSPCNISLITGLGGSSYIIGDRWLFEIFSTENGYDTVPGIVNDLYLNSETIFLDDTVLLSSEGGEIIRTRTNPIKKILQFGALSNELFNKLTISKLYVNVEEVAATPQFPVTFYSIRTLLDSSIDGLSLQRVYANGNQISDAITVDNEIISVDSELITIDSGIDNYKDAVKLEYFYGTRGFNNLSFQIEDQYSTGRLKLWAYGFIVSPTKF